jgi:hypothetical protein
MQKSQTTVSQHIGTESGKLLDKKLSAGENDIEFNAKNLASGIYYRIQAGEFSQVRKMVLLR